MSQDDVFNICFCLGLLLLSGASCIILIFGLRQLSVALNLNGNRLYEYALTLHITCCCCILYWYFNTVGYRIEQKYLTGALSIGWLLVILRPEIQDIAQRMSYNPTFLFLYGRCKEILLTPKLVKVRSWLIRRLRLVCLLMIIGGVLFMSHAFLEAFSMVNMFGDVSREIVALTFPRVVIGVVLIVLALFWLFLQIRRQI